jgi:hypothetical protein
VSDKSYHVVVTHENGAWLADVPALTGTHTFARNIPSLQTAVRELIALVEDLADGAEVDLDIDYEYRIGIPEVEAETRQLRADRERIRQEEDDLARRTDAAAKTLVDRYRFSVRDAAALTGVSKQRISQLAPSKQTAERAAKQAAAHEEAVQQTAKTGGSATRERGSKAPRATSATSSESTTAAAADQKRTAVARSSGKTTTPPRNQSPSRSTKKPASGRAPSATANTTPERKAR